jgi:integrase
MLLTEAVELWTDEQVQLVEAGAKRAGSQITAAYQLKPVLAFMGTTDLQAITSQRVLDYQAHRAREGRKPSTINSEVAKLRQLMVWAVERKLCTAVPKARALPNRRRRIDLPTIDEMARIIAHMDPARGLVVRFLVETGCRKSEAFSLRWRDIDFERNLVRIRPNEAFTPKTAHSERDIPIHQSLTRLLQKSRGKKKAEAYVFIGRGGGPRTEVDKALNSAVKAAGVKRGEEFLHLDHHTLRKAHATWQAMAGLPESTLQVRLGHVPGSRVTQQHYIHAARERDPDGVLRIPKKRRTRGQG